MLALCAVKIRPPFLNKHAYIGCVCECVRVCIRVCVCVCVCPRQVTKTKLKSGAVVKHQRVFMVYKTTSNVKGFLRAVLCHSTPL